MTLRRSTSRFRVCCNAWISSAAFLSRPVHHADNRCALAGTRCGWRFRFAPETRYRRQPTPPTSIATNSRPLSTARFLAPRQQIDARHVSRNSSGPVHRQPPAWARRATRRYCSPWHGAAHVLKGLATTVAMPSTSANTRSKPAIMAPPPPGRLYPIIAARSILVGGKKELRAVPDLFRQHVFERLMYGWQNPQPPDRRALACSALAPGTSHGFRRSEG